MLENRVIPCLLLKNKGLVKTVKFKTPRYVGDPINAVRIFNEKEVDELIFLDITASKNNTAPLTELVAEISAESFMPLAYGGGIRTVRDVEMILRAGAEKVSINTAAVMNPELITETARLFGNQSVIVSIDAKKKLLGGYEVYIEGGTKATGLDPAEFAAKMEGMGAGEILINSIDRDGTMSGYDIDLIARVAKSVRVPVVASGGAGNLSHFKEALDVGRASAVAAGSLFVFFGPRRAVLINYPSTQELSIVNKR
jgi:cyclase